MSSRPLWGFIPKRLRWPDTIPSFRRQNLGEGFVVSNLRAVKAMPNRLLNGPCAWWPRTETTPYRIGWHSRHDSLWRGWRRPWQSEAPSTCRKARRAITAKAAERKMLRDVRRVERDRHIAKVEAAFVASRSADSRGDQGSGCADHGIPECPACDE